MMAKPLSCTHGTRLTLHCRACAEQRVYDCDPGDCNVEQNCTEAFHDSWMKRHGFCSACGSKTVAMTADERQGHGGIVHEQEPYDAGECQHEWALWCPKCSHVTYPPTITGAGAIAQHGTVSTVTGEMVERGLAVLLERHPQIYQAIKTNAPAVSVRQAVRDILEAALKPQE